jgi:hypothetical protein
MLNHNRESLPSQDGGKATRLTADQYIPVQFRVLALFLFSRFFTPPGERFSCLIPLAARCENAANITGICGFLSEYARSTSVHHCFREQERDMQPPHKSPAVFSAIAGFLLMFLAAGLLVEKPHDPHLPEQNARGTMNATTPAGSTAVAAALTSSIPGKAPGKDRTLTRLHETVQNPTPCCRFLS